jgi:ribonuclease-3
VVARQRRAERGEDEQGLAPSLPSFGASAAGPTPGAPDLTQRIGYTFRDPSLLDRALTHASCKDAEHPSNERLEFLGDAVLGLVVAHFLYTAFPEMEEGPLTRVRSAVVSAQSLTALALEVGLDDALRIGRGLRREELPPSVLANAVEALIGAIFLDGGLDATRPFILWGLERALEDELVTRNERNWKSLLQELTQQADRVTPTYEVVEETGPDHQKAFVVIVLTDGVERGRGSGASKKAAEQAAARDALERRAAERRGASGEE